jgi:hypothetical protein
VGWLLQNSTGLNLGISVAQLLLGIAIGLWAKPDLVAKGRFGELAFGFWTTQWLIFTAMYLLVIRYPTQESLLLVLVDVQSLLVLACAWTLLVGDAFKLVRTLILLVIFCFAFGLYDIGLDPWNVSNPSLGHLLKWTLPSQTLSIFSLNLIGVVAYLRYRGYALPFFLVAVGYGACQQALYSATLLRFQNVSQALPEAAPWYLAAAVGKLALGALFYTLAFLMLPSSANSFPAYALQVQQEIPKRLGKAAAWIISFFIVPFLFALLAAWLVK